ncbi:unnamed protein product [Brassica rapa subsp. trilocularis]
MNRHKLKGILRTKQKVFIRCIMCGDMRRVAKVVVVGRQLFGSFMVRGRCVVRSGVVAKCVFGRCVGGDCVVVQRAVVRQVVKW